MAVVSLCLLSCALSAPETNAVSISALQEELRVAMDRIEYLESENALLNDRLAVVSPDNEAIPYSEPPRTVDPPEAEPDTPELGFWDQLDADAEASRTFGKTWVIMEYQFDTRGFNTINLTASSPLPYGFNLWGFIDFESPDGGVDDSRFDTNTFFYEVNVKRQLWTDFGLIAEANDVPGVNNAVSRYGVFYIPRWSFLKDINTNLFFKAFAVESDGDGYQISMAWNTRFPDILAGRFSVGGFIDLNFDSGPTQDDLNIVSDTQIRYRLIENLSLLAEVRYNEFLGANKDIGVGFGVQYRF